MSDAEIREMLEAVLEAADSGVYKRIVVQQSDEQEKTMDELMKIAKNYINW